MDPNNVQPPQPTPTPGPEPAMPQPQAGAVFGPQTPAQATPPEPMPSPQPTPAPSPAPMPSPAPSPMPGPTPEPMTPGPMPPQPTPSQLGTMPPSFGAKPKKGKKKLLIFSVLALVLLMGGGFVFGYYIPNQPQNVWNTGLDRTGDALTEIVNKNTSLEQIEKIEKSKVTGSLALNVEGAKITGSLESRFDQTKSNSQLKFVMETEGVEVEDINLDASIITNMVNGQRFPDYYVKLKGFSEFGFIDIFAPGLTAYEDQWISISSEYQELVVSQFTENAEGFSYTPKDELTAEEISNIAKAANQAIDEYVFTSDPSKAVIVQHEYIGKEDLGEVTGYHYKAGYNVDNTAAFCKAMVNNVMAVSGVEKFFDGDNEAKEKARESAVKYCDDIILDEYSRADAEAYRFDVWIDAKYKLIHKVRFTDEYDDTGSRYIDVGQTYLGGDEVKFFVSSKVANGGVDAELTSNFGSQKTSLLIKGENTGYGPYDYEINLDIEPYAEEIDVQKPDGTIDIEQLLDELKTANGGQALGINTFTEGFQTETN